MQFPDQKNISFALIGKNVAATANSLLVDEYLDISDGSIALLDENNKAMNGQTLTANMKVKFVQRSGTNLIYTPSFLVKDATCKLTGYTAAAEQISFVGYNGSSGSLDVIDNNNYIINVQLKDFIQGRPYDKFAAYKSVSSGATQVQIATGLLKSCLRRFAAEPFVRFERTAAQASQAAITGSATIYKVSKGSTTVYTYVKAAAANTTLTASTASVTAADVINIPSVSGRTFTFSCLDAVGHVAYIGTEAYYIADQATAADGSDNATALAAAISAGGVATATAATAAVTVTYNKDFYALPPMVLSDPAGTPATVAVTIASGNAVPVKYVAAATTSSAATFELDVAYQGETGYIYEGTTAATHIGISATVTGWGIKMMSNPQTFQINKYNYQKITFKAWLDGFTATTVTGEGVSSIGVASNQGVGTSEQVAELSEFCNYNNGKTLRGIYLTSDALPNDVVANTKYEVATITAKKIVSSGVGMSMESPLVIYLCFYKDSAQGDNIATSLNTYYGSGAFAA
jgi:hypothetical protein